MRPTLCCWPFGIVPGQRHRAPRAGNLEGGKVKRKTGGNNESQSDSAWRPVGVSAAGVDITADQGNNVVTISRPTPNDLLKITDNTNGHTWSIPYMPWQFPKVYFHGGASGDQVYATGAWVQCVFNGNGGNDVF